MNRKSEKETEFAQMLHTHRTSIYTVCFMFSKDKDEVNDLYQEVSIHLWNGFDSFAQKSDIKT